MSSSSETMAAVDARKQKLREAGKRARQLYLDRSEMHPVVEGRGAPKQKKKRMNKRCVHNKWFYRCAICRFDAGLPICKRGGSSLCYKHGAKDGSVRKANCKGCRGSRLCYEHGAKDGSVQKSYCKGCRGSQLCFEHETKNGRVLQKAFCKDCHGRSLCFEHGAKDGSVAKAYCRECYGSLLCFNHGAKDGSVLKKYCKECGGKLLCAGCKLYTVEKQGNYCRSCRTISWRGVSSERVVGDALIKWSKDRVIPLFTTANKALQRGTVSKRYRVDFLYSHDVYNTAVEVDERQHMYASYNGNCELVRMYEIALACGTPTTFIRYNPDSVHINSVLERVPRQLRHALLLEVLKESLALPSTAFLTVIYVFYDQSSKRMFGEAHDYVTTQTFATEVDYEAFVGSAYPDGCAGPAAGTPWYAKQD